MFGCYRQGEANDIGTYTVAVASVLSIFPDDIIVDVTDPVRGLPSKLKWLPTVAEVRAECERLKSLREPVKPRTRPLEIEERVSDDERARVAERLKGLRAELAGQPTANPETRRQIAEARLERFKREGIGGLKFSAEMQQKLAGSDG